MTRLFSIRSFANSHQILMGTRETKWHYADAVMASEVCNELNRQAEAWRVLRNAEEREARKK